MIIVNWLSSASKIKVNKFSGASLDHLPNSMTLTECHLTSLSVKQSLTTKSWTPHTTRWFQRSGGGDGADSSNGCRASLGLQNVPGVVTMKLKCTCGRSWSNMNVPRPTWLKAKVIAQAQQTLVKCLMRDARELVWDEPSLAPSNLQRCCGAPLKPSRRPLRIRCVVALSLPLLLKMGKVLGLLWGLALLALTNEPRTLIIDDVAAIN